MCPTSAARRNGDGDEQRERESTRDILLQHSFLRSRASTRAISTEERRSAGWAKTRAILRDANRGGNRSVRLAEEAPTSALADSDELQVSTLLGHTPDGADSPQRSGCGRNVAAPQPAVAPRNDHPLTCGTMRPSFVAIAQRIAEVRLPNIRRARRDDATQLSVIAEKTFRDTFAGVNSPEDMDLHCRTSYSEAIQAKEITDPSRVTLLCEDGGRLVGFAQLRWGKAPSCVVADAAGEIQRLYVISEFQGRYCARPHERVHG